MQNVVAPFQSTTTSAHNLPITTGLMVDGPKQKRLFAEGRCQKFWFFWGVDGDSMKVTADGETKWWTK